MQSKNAELLETSSRAHGNNLNTSYGSAGDKYLDYLRNVLLYVCPLATTVRT